MEQITREVIGNYTVKASVWIGGKRCIYAKDETGQEEKPYLKCIYTENDLFGRLEDQVTSDSYEEIMTLFADDIRAQAVLLEVENRGRSAVNRPPLRRDELLPISGVDLIGKVVALNPAGLADGYKSLAYQLLYIDGGNGARPEARGTSCFGYDLFDKSNVRYQRSDILGIVPNDKIPDYARQTLESIHRERKKEDRDAR